MESRPVVVPLVIVAGVLAVTLCWVLFGPSPNSVAMDEAVEAPDCFDAAMGHDTAASGTLRVYMYDPSHEKGNMSLELDQGGMDIAYSLKGACNGMETWQAAKVCEMADARHRIRMWRERDRLRLNIEDMDTRQPSLFAPDDRSLLLTPRRGYICFPG